jgi:hypothetical protein
LKEFKSINIQGEHLDQAVVLPFSGFVEVILSANEGTDDEKVLSMTMSEEQARELAKQITGTLGVSPC